MPKARVATILVMAMITGAMLAAALNASFAQTTALPKTADERAKFWRKIQDSCDATAAVPPSPLAKAIADVAKVEHARWGGHRIDHNGRLYVFGLVESENEETARPGAAMHHVGWWNVWRYWRHLMKDGDKSIPDYLKVTAIAGAIDETDPNKLLRAKRPDGGDGRYAVETSALLSAIDQIPAGRIRGGYAETEIKQALKEAVLRAFISDNAWSAAFISYVVDTANKGRDAEAFRSGVAHRDYIRQAIDTSKAEVLGKPAKSLYRACPIHGSTPRIGDLICYHRESACAGADPKAVRDLLAFGTSVTGRARCTAISLSHCDVVTETRLVDSKVYSIGGNVQQSVTERRLNVFKKKRGKLVFHREQGRETCEFAPNTDPTQEGSEQKLCSLNNKEWFVLLQLRDIGPKGAAGPGEGNNSQKN